MGENQRQQKFHCLSLLLASKMSQEQYYDTMTNMHSYFIPIVGAACWLFGLLFVLLLVKKAHSMGKVLMTLAVFLSVVQLVMSYFFYLTYQAWLLGIQLTATGLVGFYCTLMFDKDLLLLNVLINLFNLFCVFGKAPFLNYETDLYTLFDTSSQSACFGWFGIDSSIYKEYGICFGYITYMRMLGFAFIYLILLQTFLGYILHRNYERYSSEEHMKLDFGRGGKGSRSYESLDDKQ